MLKIRLQRVGRKNHPSFRLVLTDSKNATRSGKYLEALGSFDYRRDINKNIAGERILYWIGKGAQPTPNVHNLLINEKVITGKKINILPKKTVPKKEEPKVPETTGEAAPKAEKAAEEKTEAAPETPNA